MTESEIVSAIKTATGSEYSVDVYKRDLTGRIGSHRATFMVQMAQGDEKAVIDAIRTLSFFEAISAFETQLSTDSQVPMVYALISLDCTL